MSRPYQPNPNQFSFLDILGGGPQVGAFAGSAAPLTGTAITGATAPQKSAAIPSATAMSVSITPAQAGAGTQPTAVRPPRTPVTRTLSRIPTGGGSVLRADTVEEILKLEALQLTERQRAGLTEFVEKITQQTVSGFGQKVEWVAIRPISVTDYGDLKGGVCEIAKGTEAHRLRWLYTIELEETGGEKRTVSFGIECLAHVTGMTDSERAFCRGLQGWVKDSGLRWVLRMLRQAADAGKTASAIDAEWRKDGGREVEEFAEAVILVSGREADAVPASVRNALPGEDGRLSRKAKQRLQAIGRTVSAIQTAVHLEQHQLPVPPALIRRIKIAASRVKAFDEAK